MSSKKLNIAIVLGSVRDNREGFKAAKFIMNKLKEKHNTTLVDPKDYNLPLLNKRYHEYKKGEKIPSNLEKLHKIFKSSDAIVIVSPEYNHSIPPALSNTLDYFYSDEFAFKPSGIVSYSNGLYAGVRGAMQLQIFLTELQMPPIPFILSIPTIQNNLDENGKPLDNTLNDKASRFLTQLEWYAYALKTARKKTKT